MFLFKFFIETFKLVKLLLFLVLSSVSLLKKKKFSIFIIFGDNAMVKCPTNILYN